MKSFFASIAILIAIWLAANGLTQAFADDDPPQTAINICSGGLPSLSTEGSAQDGCHIDAVTAVHPAHAPRIAYFAQSFSHYYWHEGDQACIFTRDGPGHDHGRPGSGRDCRPGTTDQQCAYIGEGWPVFAITGQSCTEAGIPLCGGLWCE